MIIFLQYAMPMETRHATNMQTFHMMITLDMLILMMCYTEFVPEPETRSDLGYVQIAMLSVFAATTLLPLLYTSLRKVILHCIRCKNRCCSKKKKEKAILVVSAAEPLAQIQQSIA